MAKRQRHSDRGRSPKLWPRAAWLAGEISPALTAEARQRLVAINHRFVVEPKLDELDAELRQLVIEPKRLDAAAKIRRQELADLEGAQREGNRSGVTHWRRTVALSVAKLRAEAGDVVAARRLAWHELVSDARARGRWLCERVRALDLEIVRLVRNGAPACASCGKRLARARGTLEELLTEIAARPGSVPTYSEHRLQQLEAARADDAWLRRQLDGLGRDGA